MGAVTSGSVVTNTFKYNNSGATKLQLDWSQVSQSSAGTKISWVLKGYDDPYVQWEVGPVHAYIDGTCVHNFSINGDGTYGDHSEGRYQFKNWETLASGEITIPHDEDGTKSFTISLDGVVRSHGTNPNISASETFELTPIVVSHKVYFDEQGGTAVSDKTVTNGAAYGTLPDTTKTGYTFAGWYTAASGGSQVGATTASKSSDETLYAHWTANQYTLTYDANGGYLLVESDEYEGAVEQVETVSETAVFDSTVIYTRDPDGFCFKEGSKCIGWIDDKGVSWTGDINKPWTWSGAAYARNVTLYAQWDDNIEYTVTFDLKGGTASGGGSLKQTVQNGGSATPPENVTKDGKTFKGWVGDYTNVTSNRTIYALWDTTPVWILIEEGGQKVWKPYM